MILIFPCTESQTYAQRLPGRGKECVVTSEGNTYTWYSSIENVEDGAII